jgi:Ran GTPase-activating protein (RanGAP) involved in mRNA processing and transport
LSLLNLENNLITDQGVKSIINALSRHPNSTLKSLSFSRNRLVEDGCIDDIIDVLKENHSLKSLYLDKCNLSEDGKQRLQHAIGQTATFSLLV